MPKKWKEILTDPATYADDFVVTLKDGQTMSLGEMRAYDAETRGELTKNLTAKEKEIATREKNVNDASIQVSGLIEKTAASAGLSVEELLAGKQPTKRELAAATDLDESDPLLGKLVKELKGLRDEMKSTRSEIDTVKKNALGPILNTYLEDYYESKWEKVSTTLPKGSKLELKEAVEYANKNGLKDARGRLDLSKAARDLTFDERVDEEASKRLVDLRKRDADERTLSAVQRPSSLGQKTHTDPTLQKKVGARLETKNFDDVLNDALGDTDLWRGVAGQA
jgi:hypothetical protein